MGVGVSAVDPIGPALNRTGRTLFKPFNATKWATLGFCAFLATLGEGGSFSCQSFGGPGPIPGSGAHSLPEFLDEIWKAFLNNAHWVIPVAAVSLMIAVAMLWLRARGKFMLLEGIVQDRGDVVEPWKRWRAEANSYFRFELLLHVLVMLGGVSVVALGYVVALPDIRANRF